MSKTTGPSTPLIEDYGQLVDYFRDGVTDPNDRGVGTEHEKFFICPHSGEVVSYGEQGGLRDIFRALIDEQGWEPVWDDNLLIAVTKNGRSITLEPGGQVELSGGVYETIHETQRELSDHFDTLRSVINRDCLFFSWGVNPFHSLNEVSMVPKTRYKYMWNYLAKQGRLARWMMKMTNTIQPNLDYTSERDAVDLVRTALLVSPIVSAIFANSPICDREPTGMQSYRGYLWTKTDPDRCGWPRFMYERDWGFQEYIDYIVDIPMFLIKRQGRTINMLGESFRSFVENGSDGYRAHVEDFETHLSTVFPEIRLKQFVEIRGVDGGGPSHILAASALWKGLLYDPKARKTARELVDGISPQRHSDLFMQVYKKGLEAKFKGTKMLEHARRVVDIGAQGLDRLAEQNGHESERVFVEPLERIVQTGKTAADRLLEDWQRSEGDLQSLADKYAL